MAMAPNSNSSIHIYISLASGHTFTSNITSHMHVTISNIIT